MTTEPTNAATNVSPARIEAARRRIVRVMTRIAEPEDSENERLLREALDLLDEEVKLA